MTAKPSVQACLASGTASNPAPKITSDGGGLLTSKNSSASPIDSEADCGNGASSRSRAPATASRSIAGSSREPTTSPVARTISRPDVPDERRDQHGGLGAFEHAEPLARHLVVFEPFDVHVNGAAAADAEAPDRILGEIVGHGDRFAGHDDVRGGVGNGRLQASARQRALVGPVLTHEHARAFAAVGAPPHANHRGDGDALPGRAGRMDRLQEPFGFATIHHVTMA